MVNATAVEPRPNRRPRIIALDIIRGYLLLAIIVNHIPWAPSLFFLASGGGALLASPAEGFFVITGVLVGYLYGPRILSSGKHVCQKIWKRAGLLYVLSVAFTLLFTFWASALPEGRIPLPMWEHGFTKFLINTFALTYAYGWTDFLRMYAVFMVGAPAMLWFIAKGKWWILALLSVAMWTLLRDSNLFLPFSTWQLLFVAGTIIGFHMPTIERATAGLPGRTKRLAATALIGSAAATFIASVGIFIVNPYFSGQPALLPDTLAALFDKRTLGVGRLLLGTLWLGALFVVVRRYEARIQSATKGIIEVFGKRSLLTYCSHAVLLFAILTVFAPTQTDNVFRNTVITSIILCGMYVIVRYGPTLTKLLLRR